MHLACPCDDFVRRSASFGWQRHEIVVVSVRVTHCPIRVKSSVTRARKAARPAQLGELFVVWRKLTACGKGHFIATPKSQNLDCEQDHESERRKKAAVDQKNSPKPSHPDKWRVLSVMTDRASTSPTA